MVNKIITKAAFNAGPSVIGRTIPGWIHLDNLVVLNLQDQLAADSTIGTGSLYPVYLPGTAFPQGKLRPQRTRWANCHTTAAEFTGAVVHWAVCSKTDIGAETAVKNADGFHPVDLAAGPDAAAAENTFITVNLNKRVGIINWIMVFGPFVTVFRDIVFIG